MADPVQIPIDVELSWQSLSVTLAGSVFNLEISWNTRSEQWSLNISDGDGVLLLAGVAIVADTPLIDRFKDARLPHGDLMLLDVTGAGREATRDNINDTLILLFTEPD